MVLRTSMFGMYTCSAWVRLISLLDLNSQKPIELEMKRLMNIAAAVTSFCALQGCAFNTLNKGLPMLINEPIESAVNVLGLPNQQMNFGSDVVYIWDNRYNATIPIFSHTTSTTTGYVGTTPITTTTTTPHTNYVPVEYQCQIKLQVNPSGTIVRWEYFGNEGGCERYANGLKRLIPKN